MGFESVRRRGRVWEDAKKLDSVIKKFPFATSGSNESAFERGFATSLMANQDMYDCKVITQIGRDSSVESVYCFGKKHRPDMTLDTNGIAIELKFITYSGLKDAIGQGHLYRLKYKFVFLVLIISEERKAVYEEIENGQEKDLDDTLSYLADNMNIFTYIVPSFSIKHPGVRKVISFFPEEKKEKSHPADQDAEEPRSEHN
ncbi:hypothetical protein [Thiohalophilus thiocyanatoxydans]|uniref:Uncharacterized protein n=1 Tax=Thiohalophilus thiocyanatoxydans TaxID=381308 RepID=A0A4R8IPJ8_9GAMM|nr:hypothetical protein [Thiohalophilus thiocyanatoxydans]TDX99328.1 hypothetical protein EDC23_2541 [Thiohalophilus thiocyanatoxydans]